MKVRSLIDVSPQFTFGKVYDVIDPTICEGLPGEVWVIADNGSEFFFWMNDPEGDVDDECVVIEENE